MGLGLPDTPLSPTAGELAVAGANQHAPRHDGKTHGEATADDAGLSTSGPATVYTTCVPRRRASPQPASRGVLSKLIPDAKSPSASSAIGQTCHILAAGEQHVLGATCEVARNSVATGLRNFAGKNGKDTKTNKCIRTTEACKEWPHSR